MMKDILIIILLILTFFSLVMFLWYISYKDGHIDGYDKGYIKGIENNIKINKIIDNEDMKKKYSKNFDLVLI